MSDSKPSGAEGRRRRMEREEQARKDDIRRRKSAGARTLEEIPPPPVGDPVAGVAWANDVACTLLDEVIHDKQIDAEKRWRYGSDLIAKIGMLHAKAHVQKRLKDLEKDSGLDAAEPDNESEGLEDYPVGGLPPTSRFRARPRQPDALSGHVPDPPQGGDGGDPVDGGGDVGPPDGEVH